MANILVDASSIGIVVQYLGMEIKFSNDKRQLHNKDKQDGPLVGKRAFNGQVWFVPAVHLLNIKVKGFIGKSTPHQS